MELTKNFTYEEMISSNTAKKYKINNVPDEIQKLKLEKLCKDILLPIRDKYNKPITVSSGFRCRKLNLLINGSATSLHMNGEAADIHSVSDSKKDNKELFELIELMIKDKEIVVGLLINEKDYNWIHISLPNARHTNLILCL